MYSVLSVLRLSLLWRYHSAVLSTSALRSLQSSSISSAEQVTLVSAAYMFEVHLLRHCSKSLTYRMKRRGSKHEPEEYRSEHFLGWICGRSLDSIAFYSSSTTYGKIHECFLLEKAEVDQLSLMMNESTYLANAFGRGHSLN